VFPKLPFVFQVYIKKSTEKVVHSKLVMWQVWR